MRDIRVLLHGLVADVAGEDDRGIEDLLGVCRLRAVDDTRVDHDDRPFVLVEAIDLSEVLDKQLGATPCFEADLG